MTRDTNSSGPTAMTVTPAAGLIDEPLHIQLSGVPPDAEVTVRAHLLNQRGVPWSSHATFIEGACGSVDLTTDAPVSGTYSGVDGEGLIASLSVSGNLPRGPFEGASVEPLTIELVAEISGCRVACATARRLYVAENVQTTVLRERERSGLFFRPTGGEPRPGVIVLGGSSGGLFFASQVAALLASRGFASLALAYFGMDDLPEHLVDIPIEYFSGALEWFASQPEVRPDALGVIGRSRGAELALLLGSRIPSIRSVVAYCPSSTIWNGLRGDVAVDGPAWTARGRPIPFVSLTTVCPPALLAETFRGSPVTLSPLFEAALALPLPDNAIIPVERTNGPILLISGDDDQMWPSARMGDQIMERLAAHHHPFRSRHCHYPGAGHLMRPPGLPTSVLQGKFALGGRGPTQAGANRAAWSETLAFLGTTLGVPSRADAVAAVGGER
jgi:dienelactone hydrolase